MKASKLTASCLAVSLVASGLTASFQSPARATESEINQLLIQHGLNPTKFCTGAVVIWVTIKEKQVCAVPNSQYPAGVYRLTNDLQIVSVTGDKKQPAPPVQQPAPPVYPPPTIITPPILFTSNPSQPVSPVISAQINASLSARGLTLTSCSANPGVVVMLGPYMACAYPTPVYPPGRYSLTFF